MTKTRMQKTLGVGQKILIVLLIMAGLMIGILEFAEGMKDPIRLGLQDYLSRASGDHKAEITSLEKSELFPQVYFIIEGVSIRDKDDATKILATADKIEIATSFWKTFFGFADYHTFKVENAVFAADYALPQKLVLSFSGISDPSPDITPPYFVLDGVYNKRPLLVTAEMRRGGDQKSYHYDFAREFPVTFKLGGTEANARFQRNLASIEFAQFALASGDYKVILRTEGMSFKPLHIRFIGEMGENPLAGELTQGAAGDYELYVTPGVEDPAFSADLQKFITSIRADLGLNEGVGNIKIEIRAPVVAQQGVVENKEQKQQ